MPGLRICLLGGFELHDADGPLPPPATLKARSLLAYLVVYRDRACTREQLADLFWPDRPRDRALRSLSTALWHIRRVLPREDYVLADAREVQFNPASDYWFDAEEFRVSCSGVSGSLDVEPESISLEIRHLESAVALYQGDFLAGFYDDWCLEERYLLEGLYLRALERLVAAHEALDQAQDALHYVELLLNLDPIREDLHRRAISLQVRLGDRVSAVRQARRCQAVLRAELGVELQPETASLCDELLSPAWRWAPGEEASAERSPSPRGSPAFILERPPFVGREAEWETLLAHWAQADSGHGHVVLVSGEAGIGKTRLVEELGQHVRQRGGWVAYGRCYEYECTLPHGLLTDLLRASLAIVGAEALERLPPWQVAELVRLAPELSEQFQLPPASSPPSDREQARLLDALTFCFLSLAKQTPLLLVLEDLHWAHNFALTWLHYLARHLSGSALLLVTTYRREEVDADNDLERLALQLEQDGIATRLTLTCLPRDDLARWMVGASDSLITRIHHQTDGNPFFVLETLRTLSEKGWVRLAEERWVEERASEPLPIPASVCQVIQMRLERLSPLARQAATVAAVIGQVFDFELLEQVWGHGEELTLEALDHLLRRRLVREGDGPTDHDYEFDHHLVREVIYQGIHYRRRRRLHRLVGETLERLYVGRPGVEGELALHFREAGERVRALPYLLQAGDRARGLYAYQEAIDYYHQALEILMERGEYEQAARTLMKTGLTYHISFDFQRARQAYEEGFELWQRVGQSRSTALPPPAPHALRADWYDPTTLDPAKAKGVISIGVIEQLFSGLVERSPDMGIVPGVARTWDVLDQGRGYIFHLRDDVQWHDGTPVTAGDFEYAWKRVLDPATGSPSAGLLYDVRGARAFHRGELPDPESVGVRALDDVTLVVELEGPTSYLPHLLVHCASLPVPRHIVEAYGQAWAEAGNIATNGPFRLEVWRQGCSMVLSRNPEYHADSTGNVQQVELSLLDEWSARLERYEADDLDILHLWGLPPAERDGARQRHAGEYISFPSLQTYYVGFDVSQPPFDDRRVRQAFALATDRHMLANVVMRGHEFPATGGFVPVGMPGHAAGIGLPYDPDRARRLLAEAGYPSGRGFPAVEAVGPRDRQPLSSSLQAQWRENLGVGFRWELLEYGAYYDRLDIEPPPIFLSGWLADYPDPDDFLRASPHRSHTRLQDETYTGLVRQARRVTDQATRMKLYRQADKILVEHAVIIPLTYGRLHLLVKPWVRKLPMSPVKAWFWKDVILDPH